MTQKETMQHTPQSNFYLWQNGKWLDDPENKIPDEYSSWGSFVRLSDISLKNQIKILNNLKEKLITDDKLSEDEKRIAIVYQKTMQKYYDWENGKGDYEPIKTEFEIMDKILNNEDHIDSLAKYGSYCMMNGIRFPIDIDKENDLEDSDHVKVAISSTGFLLPGREYYFDDNFAKQRKYLKEHLQNIEEIMSKNGIKLVDNFVDNLLEFEKTLAYISMTQAQSRLYDQYYTKTNLTDFYKKIDKLRYIESKLENYSENDKDVSLSDNDKKNVEKLMEAIYDNLELRNHMKNNYQKTYSNDYQENPDNAFTIMAFDGDYMKRVFKYILNPDHSNQLLAYYQYNAINSMANYCTKELNEEFFDFHGRKLQEQKEQKTYEKRATGIVNSWLGELLGKLYVQEYFSSDSKIEIKNMIDSVLSIMNQSLETNDWLTSETKQKALLKLSTFRNKIGYPDVWKNYDQLTFTEEDTLSDIRNKVKIFIYKTEFLDKINTLVDKTKWLMAPQTVNAYYHPQLNEIVFPAAILQPPFYQTEHSEIDMELEDESYYQKLGFDPLVPINHGGIMAVIAHEITHGYDDQGRKFDNEGNMVDWWTPEDTKLFTEKTNSIVKQVEQYEYIDSEKKKHTMNAQLTMGENLADLGGLTLSLKALLDYKDENNKQIYNNPEALKLFFKSWANIWKCNYMEQAKIQRLVSDPHAPVDFRGNLVRNVDQFHEVFDVKKDDDMYLEPGKRVKMW